LYWVLSFIATPYMRQVLHFRFEAAQPK
jgi:hypothetical protein